MKEEEEEDGLFTKLGNVVNSHADGVISPVGV
jgi:hypothetical protein